MKYVNGSWVVIPVSSAIPGDVNGDGEVTAADVTLLYNILLNDNYEGAINPDQSGDGEVERMPFQQVIILCCRVCYKK